MALQFCPNCRNESFNWVYDEEDIPPTTWVCGSCGYSASEDESIERECGNCGKKTASRLEDGTKIYWWCSSCNKVTL